LRGAFSRTGTATSGSEPPAASAAIAREGCCRHTSLPEGRSGPVRSFAEDPQGRLWIAAGKDLLLLDQGRLTAFPGWRASSVITVIYRDPLGGMWVGTDWDGLYQWTGKAFRNYRTQDGLAGNRVRALLRDRQGALWISARSGLA
jgi:ligand-binding sensor domain-containing protein